MTRKPAPGRVKSNYLRRRRVAQAANDVARGVQVNRQDTERRGIPNDVPAPVKRRA